MIHHATNGNNPFASSYGIQGQYRLSKRISLLVELSGMTTFKNFDGLGRPNRPGDNMLLLTAGLSFSIGKSGWKRVVDAGPYMQMNERLVSRTGSLSAENRYYAGLCGNLSILVAFAHGLISRFIIKGFDKSNTWSSTVFSPRSGTA